MAHDPDRIPTLPAPPRVPRDPRAEQPTPIPRLSDLEEIKTDSPEPGWLVKLRADVRASVKREVEAREPTCASVKREVEARGSQSDLKQDAAIAMAVADIAAVKADMAGLKSQSKSTGAEVTKVSDSLTGFLSPKFVAAIIALGTLANLVLEILRGHKP